MQPNQSILAPDLIDTWGRIAAGKGSAVVALQASIAAASDGPARDAFVATTFEGARAAADAADRLRLAGAPPSPLGGLAVSVKDLFDVAGQVTAAASLALADRAPAAADSLAVARLRRAGAAFIGRTHMTEFAFSGVGLNPHHPTLVNPATLRLDPSPRIPGGSTSGGAASVATGAAWAALGSDTGGSIRIPAALQGLVGFKNTARLTPTDGAVPLSTTLDTVCAITRSVRDAVRLHELLADRRVALRGKPLHTLRLGVPTTTMTDALDATVAAAFERSLAALSAAGATVERIALAELAEVPAINATGGFSAAESWAWHRALLAADGARYDPRVAARIRRGADMTAADYIDLIRARRAWMQRMAPALAGFDAMLSPTVPCVAPPIGDLAIDDTAFFALNGLLLRNPSIVNLLDGCALSLPCHRPDELPVGLMVWHGALADDDVLDVSLAIEAALAPLRR